MRKQLDFWMSQGISDPLARATTITLYTDVDQFNESLGFEDNTTISIALVSPSGKVHWKGKGRGRFDEMQFSELMSTLDQLISRL